MFMLERNDVGGDQTYQMITKQVVTIRATIGEIIGGNLPVLEPFNGVKFFCLQISKKSKFY